MGTQSPQTVWPKGTKNLIQYIWQEEIETQCHLWFRNFYFKSCTLSWFRTLVFAHVMLPANEKLSCNDSLMPTDRHRDETRQCKDELHCPILLKFAYVCELVITYERGWLLVLSARHKSLAFIKRGGIMSLCLDLHYQFALENRLGTTYLWQNGCLEKILKTLGYF